MLDPRETGLTTKGGFYFDFFNAFTLFKRMPAGTRNSAFLNNFFDKNLFIP